MCPQTTNTYIHFSYRDNYVLHKVDKGKLFLTTLFILFSVASQIVLLLEAQNHTK
jgi:hypothetical protein